MARPLIGITTYVVPAKWSYWDLEAALVPAAYVQAVEQAGGRALLVPPARDAVAETLDGLDGLVFSGGSDLDPELYGQEAHEETSGIVRRRDDAERFPHSLRDAIDALEAGTMARAAFGDDVVDHYLNYARTEQRLFDQAVTCYEREQLFERG